MRKYLLLITITLFSLVFLSCTLTMNVENISSQKEAIVYEKYGEIEYVNEYIIIYKNLEAEFADVEGIDYIIDNSGRRSGVSPELRNNFYVFIDIVRHDDVYKLLVYNNIMRSSADKTQMFVLTDYFLPLEVEDMISLFDELSLDFEMKDYNLCFARKDSNLNGNLTNTDDLSLAFYDKLAEGDIFMSLYNNTTGYSLLGTYNDLILGNVNEKEIYYPLDLDYNNYTRYYFDTLNGFHLEFSKDNGQSFIVKDDYLDDFDVWDELLNNEVENNVFFYAFTFDEFLIKVGEARNPGIYTYYYPNDNDFDNLIETYNEEFFNEHILVFYYKFEAYISKNYVYSVTKKDDLLTINVNRFEGMAAALSSWLEIITIKKTDLADIEKVNLVVRTITPLQSSVVAYIDSEYIRDFYINGLTMDDFADLDNLKDIRFITASLNVDLRFNRQMSDEDLSFMIDYLENNPNVKSLGYKGKDFIRIQMNHHFFDEVVNKTLVITDFIDDDQLISEYNLSISIMNVNPFTIIEFILIDKGKEHAYKMMEDLKTGDYLYINKESLYSSASK